MFNLLSINNDSNKKKCSVVVVDGDVFMDLLNYAPGINHRINIQASVVILRALRVTRCPLDHPGYNCDRSRQCQRW